MGALGVYRTEAGLPTARESEIMAHAAQLAGIAIERRLAEEALRSSEAKYRGLMVEAICKVGRALGIATVAESVETAEVLAALERIGVDFAQGYHMARPRPLAELAP